MKNFLLKLLTIVFAFTLCLGIFSACGGNGGEPSHTHNYNILKYDENNHWQECSCGDKQDVENHKGGTATETEKAKCSVCNQEYGELLATTGLYFIEINEGTEYAVSRYTGTSTEVYIPSIYNGIFVTSIRDVAFYGCESLTSVEIPNSVTSIGDSAFYSCDSLTSVEIPNSVTSIGDSAFSRCTSLTSVEIPNSVTSIEDGAFSYCSSLESITVAEDNKNYKSIDGNLYSKNGKTLIQYAKGKKATSFIIPNSVTSIGCYAFCSCDSLESIKIPNSVTSIGGHAFSACDSLESIEIPNRVTSIGGYAFSGCDSLIRIKIPNSVTSMGWYVFSYCSSLTYIYCEAISQPSGWESEWKDHCGAMAYWSYKGD